MKRTFPPSLFAFAAAPVSSGAVFSAPLAPVPATVAQTTAPAIPGVTAPASPAAAGAAQSGGSALSGLPDINLSWSGYFEALAILCFVLAALWAVLWLLKRRGNAGGGLFASSVPGMRVESRLALGPKKWLLVVRYLDRRLILGVTEQSIRLLTELYDDDIPAAAQSKTESGSGFFPARAGGMKDGSGTGKSAGNGAGNAAKATPDKDDDLNFPFAAMLGKDKDDPRA